MKKWQVVTASLLALLIVVVTPLSMLAADNEASTGVTSVNPASKGGLAIVAPRVVLPGSSMSLTVFNRQDQTPESGVQVWSISCESRPSLRADLTALKATTTGINRQNLRTWLESNAGQVGVTDETGKINCSFEHSGNVCLIAVKAEYSSGFSMLAVRDVLTISGPAEALQGNDVTFTVSRKGTAEPVSGAAIWAVAREDKAALKAAIKAELRNPEVEPDLTAILLSQAQLMGTTAENGEITCAFEQSGCYFLIAVLDSNISGFNRISIEAP